MRISLIWGMPPLYECFSYADASHVRVLSAYGCPICGCPLQEYDRLRLSEHQLHPVQTGIRELNYL